MTRVRLIIASIGTLQAMVFFYCVWQFWWMSSAWGAVVHEGGSVEEMSRSIEYRIGNLHAGLMILGATIVVGALVSIDAANPRPSRAETPPDR